MPRTGWRTTTLTEKFVEKVKTQIDREYASKPASKPAIGAYIEEHLWPIVEENEILRQYGPMLEKLGVDSEKIEIRDNRPGVNRIAELTFNDGVLWCNIDESDSCIHVGFAWSIPAVYQMMHSRGKKMPRRVKDENEE